jgi:hypothetical protein
MSAEAGKQFQQPFYDGRHRQLFRQEHAAVPAA